MNAILALALAACRLENTPAEVTAAIEPPELSFGEPGTNPDENPTEPTVPSETDADSDGYGLAIDCDDTNPDINPGAIDDTCDGVDWNCDGSDLLATARSMNECGGVDIDGDGFFDVGFDADGVPYVVDCNDTDPLIHPGADEICDDDDQDCDGLVDEELTVAMFADSDLDGFGNPDSLVIAACDGGPGLVDNDLDCDDANSDINPEGVETPYDEVDQDCDGHDLDDVDCDGYGLAIDCDDADPLAHPDAVEVCGNLVDENCDGLAPALGAIRPDADGDGQGDMTFPADTYACDDAVPEGFVFGDARDCNDTDANIYDGAVEIDGDGVDQNCDGTDTCPDGESIVSGNFTAPAGSTFMTLFGRREADLDGFSDDLSWTDGVNDPEFMEVVFTGASVSFAYQTCAADADAVWVVNGTYTDALGVTHWLCEGESLTTVTAEVWYDLEPETVNVFDWGGGCDATWSR